MPRYIDADALIFEEKLLKDNKILGMNGTMMFGRTDSKTLQMFASAFKQMIDKAPAADVVPRSEVDKFIQEIDQIQKDKAEVTYFKEQLIAKAKQEAYKEILELIPPKMISESVRCDSPYGISRMCNVSMEEAEIIKEKYYKLQELRKKYIGEKK